MAGEPTLEVGDTVLIRGIFVGDGDVAPEEVRVDVFSKTTQYPISVRREDVTFFGPTWWPPQDGDVVISGTEPWRFARSQKDGKMWAYSVDVDGGGASALGGEPEDAEMWRGSHLVVRGGEMTV